MTESEYIATLRDLLSRDPERIRQANRRLWQVMNGADGNDDDVAADLVLAAVGL